MDSVLHVVHIFDIAIIMEKSGADVFVKQLNETIGLWIGYLDGYTLEQLCQKPGQGSGR